MRDELHPVVRPWNDPWEEHREWRKKKAEKEKEYYDRGTRALAELEEGEQVLIWHKEEWQRGVVKERLARPRSYVVEISATGQKLERNRAQIRRVCSDMRDESTKKLRAFPFFQRRTEVPVLVDPPPEADPARTEEDDEDGPTAANEEGERDEETEESDGEEFESDNGDEEEYDTPEAEEEPEEDGYQTRAGRRVRAPDRYSPS